MLTATDPPGSLSRPHERSLALRPLIRVSCRTAGLGRTAALMVGGALPLVITVARGRSDIGGSLTVLALVAGASVGGVADDPAAELLAPCPIPASTRMIARLLMTVAVISTFVAAALLAGALAPGLPEGWSDRIPEFAFASTAAAAVGLFARRRGEPHGAMAGITTGLIFPLTIAALAFRWPAHLPGLSSGPIHDRWWYLAATALALACHAGRDIARPPLFPRHKDPST